MGMSIAAAACLLQARFAMPKAEMMAWSYPSENIVTP